MSEPIITFNNRIATIWPICPNCAGGLSETDFAVGECTQCGYKLTESEDDDDDNE